ncbi:Mak10 subunit, NatC N-terminal acetyltransferase-domain-containing protein [Tricharina praecox]|uniref:Mak10 subunit, NatC N-terminal acetyltransferase-domain-containing protein n=1 Tax=Tricharina praecox TaxID=43433 RepID=UPI00221E88EF|nr:Mak10 subunit, NatC N-terminal acetyltransferase-domain-containing protein [Tricharina praecox]KAI5852246.1 Mak10 subunit, NatC N-terminal acetyltransferase-domain-containing protein [Tricharina praecox]
MNGCETNPNSHSNGHGSGVEELDPPAGIAKLQLLDDHDDHDDQKNTASDPNIHHESAPQLPQPATAPMSRFIDITREFIEASEKLDVGQLVKDHEFTLFQAVGALEIGDLKMDSGLLEPEYELFDAWKPRLPEELVGIMDRLLCNEMAWHSGSALSQTLFANLYIDQLLSSCPTTLKQATFGARPGTPADLLDALGQDIVQSVLRPYCIALIKCCGYVCWQVPSERMYEEEDFVQQTYGLPLLQIVDAREVFALLESALEWLDENKGAPSLSEELATAMRNRLLLRKSLLENFSLGAEMYHEGVESTWTGCLELVAKVEKEHALAKEVPEAWSMSVQRKLASSVPPRSLVELPFEEAATTLKQLCAETKDILKILNYAGATNTMTYFMHFGARRPAPLPYTRSLIQSLFMKDVKIIGKMPVKCILFDDLSELCYPMQELLNPANFEVEAPQSPQFQIARRMDWFVERAGKAYINLYRDFCQNRSRLRRILCKSILDWDSLQVEAEEIDSEIRTFTLEEPLQTRDGPQYSFSLSSWVYHYKLHLMETVVLLGFELEIFPLHEFAGMYWYLQYYLRTRAAHVERICSFVTKPPASSSSSAEDQEAYQKTHSLLNYHLLTITSMQDLSTGLVYLYCVLARHSLLGPTPPADALRYEGRLKPFLTIGCPEVVAYSAFRDVVDNVEISDAELLSYAAEHLQEAKRGYMHIAKLDADTARATLCEQDWRKNMQRLLRSCFGAAVAVGVLAREMEVGGLEGVKVSLDRGAGYHEAFPVPVVGVRK